MAEVLRQANLPCECLGVSRHNPVQAISRLARSLRRFAPQLVQSFMFHANLAARLADARTPDKFEAQSADFFRRVASGYAKRAAADPARFVLIDAPGGPSR